MNNRQIFLGRRCVSAGRNQAHSRSLNSTTRSTLWAQGPDLMWRKPSFSQAAVKVFLWPAPLSRLPS